MKILFYCEEYPPAKNGGIGTVTKIVAEALVQRGHQIWIVGSYPYGYPYYGKGKQPFFQIINGVRIYSLTHFTYRKYFKGAFLKIFQKCIKVLYIEHVLAQKAIIRIENFIEEISEQEGIGIIELTDYFSLIGYLRKAVNFRHFNKYTLMRIHGSHSFIQYYKSGKISKVIKENDLNHINRVDLVLGVSKFSSQFIKEKLNYTKNIKVIYNPIDTKYFISEHSTISNINTVNKFILYFGKIKKDKGTFAVIKSFNLLASVYKDLYLHIVGDGEIETAKKLIDNYAEKRVVFKQFMGKYDLIKEIDQSFICVLPSYYENFSMAALEVLARGKPLIYTKRASGPEIIEEGINGLLVDPDNVREIAQKIELLINNTDLASSMAILGYKTCKDNFAADIVINQLEEEYAKYSAF